MHWDNGWHDGPGGWGWLAMAMTMVAFWGGLSWIIVSVLRRGSTGSSTGSSIRSFDSAPASSTPVSSTASPTTLSRGPEDILHERLARGEIDVEEYRQRLDALREKTRT